MSRSHKLEVTVAKLYVFLLPFRMITPFEFLIDIMGPLANYIDTIFLLIGIMLWTGHSNRGLIGSDKKLFRTILNTVLYLNLSSLLMSIVIYAKYGDYNNKSPFMAVIPMMLFYFQYVLMFLYNIRVFQLLTYKTLVNIISRLCWVLLAIGYFQVVVILGMGVGIYDSLAKVIGGFALSDDFFRVYLTTTEAAGAGGLLGVFVFPFLYARYIHGHKNSLYQIVLWLIPLYFTHSSTAYILFAIDSLIFCVCMVTYRKSHGNVLKLGMACLLPLFLIMGLSQLGVLNIGIWDDISYILIDKVTDQNNGSTATRSVPWIINSKCFMEMPVMGVGNGLQGYFYDKYFPTHLLRVHGTDLPLFYKKIHESGTIANGGCFLPGYLSGYGIIGIIVLINVIIQLRRTRKAKAATLGIFNEMFIMGSVSFFVYAISSEMYCLYFAWFVLSIPFMNFHKRLNNAHSPSNQYNS